MTSLYGKYRELRKQFTMLESFNRVVQNKTYQNLPEFATGKAAAEVLPPNSLFWMGDEFILCRVAEEPGVYLSRGEFGNTVWCYIAVALVEVDYNVWRDTPVNPSRLLAYGDTFQWKVWDTEFGFL